MRRLAAALLGALFVVAACGTSAPPAVPEPGGGAFPVRVEHALGSTEIPAQPKRVVSLGYQDQDTILALGVVPVAIREFTGNQPFATWPWASDKLAGEQPQVLTGQEIGVETIAALQPDLIVAISARVTLEQYATYSQIAPTITQPAGAKSRQAAWQDVTRMVGTALGRPTEAEELVTGLEGRFAAVREQYPQLQGKKGVVAAASNAGNGNYFVWQSADNRGRFLEAIGLSVPATFDQLAGELFYADVSGERLSLLDENDVVAWLTIPGTPNAGLEQQTGYPPLRVGQEGRVVNLTVEQGVALSFSSVLSLPVLLDEVPAQLAAHVGG